MTRALALCALLALSACSTPQMNADGTPPDRTACGPEMPGTGAGKVITGTVVGIGVGVATGGVGSLFLIGKEIAQADCREKVRELRGAYFRAQCIADWHPVCNYLGIDNPNETRVAGG